jgi:hypothetical protein
MPWQILEERYFPFQNHIGDFTSPWLGTIPFREIQPGAAFHPARFIKTLYHLVPGL